MKDLKVKRNSIIVLLITLVIFYFIIKDNFNDVMEVLKVANITWLVVALLVHLLSIFFEAIILKKLTCKYNREYNVRKAFGLNLITKFFNGITPSSTGGQPFQIYELKKDKLRVSDATTVVMEFFLIYQIALIILSILCYVLNIIFNLVDFNTTLTILFYLGLTGNVFTLIIAIVIGRSKKVIKKLLVFITKVLSRLKIVKNKKEIIEKVERTCSEFNVGFIEMNKDKVFLFKCVVIQLLAFVIRFSVSIFIFKAIGIGNDINFVECLVASIFVFLAGSYVPIPGGSGGMEYAYYGFFSKFISGAILSSCLILWRLITYLIPLIIGGIVFSFRSNKK